MGSFFVNNLAGLRRLFGQGKKNSIVEHALSLTEYKAVHKLKDTDIRHKSGDAYQQK